MSGVRRHVSGARRGVEILRGPCAVCGKKLSSGETRKRAKAAQAANAAHAQGKFFEYTALLFKRQNALDVASLKKYASELGLDRARFDAELDGGKYAADVRRDMDDAVMYGAEGTPTIFVNGVMLRDLTAEALHAAIDRAFAGSAQKSG